MSVPGSPRERFEEALMDPVESGKIIFKVVAFILTLEALAISIFTSQVHNWALLLVWGGWALLVYIARRICVPKVARV